MVVAVLVGNEDRKSGCSEAWFIAPVWGTGDRRFKSDHSDCIGGVKDRDGGEYTRVVAEKYNQVYAT